MSYTFKGTYAAGTYSVGDVVGYEDTAYVCVETTALNPANTDAWHKLASPLAEVIAMMGAEKTRVDTSVNAVKTTANKAVPFNTSTSIAATTTGAKGSIGIGGDAENGYYLCVCVAKNTWKKVALSDFE